jgi:hypothetical protein
LINKEKNNTDGTVEGAITADGIYRMVKQRVGTYYPRASISVTSTFSPPALATRI